jgi:hypothetical protein
MIIDCDSCTVARGPACDGCLVSALLDTPDEIGALDAGERYAIEVFARAGFDVDVLAAPPVAVLNRSRRPRSPRRRIA